ncbi:complement resistance protein TraT [Aeromonas salmonicida]|uniref:complement resistance protein TraT n=1 Tax=Aeromonas salmonicida TaxID=645 RepID=UPI0037EC1321
MKKTVLALVTISILGLSGCSAVHTAVSKRNLDVQTKMSETIFLEPATERTVYLQLRNTSTEQGMAIEPKLRQALESKGMVISNNPDTAQYWIQANILSVGKMDLRDAQNALLSGWGAGAMGAAAGAGVLAYNSSSSGAALGAGLVGALAGVAADAMVEDTNYTMITDLQIAEKAPTGVTVTTDNIAMLKQGSSAGKVQTSSAQGNRHKYQTRIVSNANQVNLDFKDAKPVLEDQLANTLSGFF